MSLVVQIQCLGVVSKWEAQCPPQHWRLWQCHLPPAGVDVLLVWLAELDLNGVLVPHAWGAEVIDQVFPLLLLRITGIACVHPPPC